MKAEDLALVRTIRMFQGLEEERIAALFQGSYLQKFPRNTVLFEKGDRADFLMVLLEGGVELFAPGPDAREAVIDILWPVDAFILAAALTGSPYLMSARTLQPSRILLLEAGAFRRSVNADPVLSARMMAALAGHFRRLVRQIKDLKLRTGGQRLANFLIRLVAETGDGTSAVLPFDKRTLASRLGMTPENLSRAFATLRDHGVEVQGTRVTLADGQRLAEYCHPDPLIDEFETELTIPPG